MANGHGGRRKGAGRKPGSPTERRREIVDKAAAEGISPLELQLSAMRELWRRAHADGEMDIGLAAQACAIAKDCAPYIHPRLAAVDARVGLSGQVDVSVTQEERRRRAIEAIDAAFAERPAERDVEFGRSNTGQSPYRASGELITENSAMIEQRSEEGEATRQGRPIPRDFARQGPLAAAPDVARLAIRYRPSRVIGEWSG
jgi:hypothetical protein